MPASQARTETRLPRALVSRLAAEEHARTVARGTPAEPDPLLTLAAPAAPADAAPAAPTPPAPAVDPRESDPLYWKHRFNVTEGMLRAERASRQTETGAVRQQLAELQEQVRTLQATKPAEPIDLSKFFSKEQIEQYGEEQCRVTATAAQAAANEKIQTELDTRLKPIVDARKQDQTDAAARAVTEFTDKLTELVPNYREIDVSPGWFHWLDQTDEPTQLARQEILDRHVARKNAPALAKMFEAYLKTQTPPAPPMTPHGTAASTSAPAPAAPAAAGGAPSDAEVREFYKRAAIGRVTDAERATFDARMKLRDGR